MLAEGAPIRHRDRFRSFDEKKERRASIDVGSIRRSFGDNHVITWLVRQSSVVRFKSPCALMHEVRFVSIRIPYEVDHRRSVDRQVETRILALHNENRSSSNGWRHLHRKLGTGKRS